MTDGPSAIDSLAEQGPSIPMETLRPAVSEQRVLILDGAEPMMIDLAQGSVRRWENGPPISVPCLTTPFDIAKYKRVQIQVLRDPRPSSVDATLLALDAGSIAVDVVQGTGDELRIDSMSRSVRTSIGGSPAIVISLEPQVRDTSIDVICRVRNAESMEWHSLEVSLTSPQVSLTIGGASTTRGVRSRRRLIPVHVDVLLHEEPVDQLQRLGRAARRVAGNLRGGG